ncbi:MAG: SPFH domain-containing protein [Acidobacteria bacterium]|nr:SPFH domain-containing protein [Acidobacteriota bacterium]
MSNSKYVLAGLALLGLVLLIGAGVAFANIKYTQEGTVKVVTYFGRIERVYRPEDGWFTTLAPGRQAYEVNIKSFTETAPVRVTSKDNAALQVEISLTAFTDPSKIEEYVRKYGFTEDERHRRRSEILKGLMQTEARNAFSEYGTYDVSRLRLGRGRALAARRHRRPRRRVPQPRTQAARGLPLRGAPAPLGDRGVGARHLR